MMSSNMKTARKHISEETNRTKMAFLVKTLSRWNEFWENIPHAKTDKLLKFLFLWRFDNLLLLRVKPGSCTIRIQLLPFDSLHNYLKFRITSASENHCSTHYLVIVQQLFPWHKRILYFVVVSFHLFICLAYSVPP